MSKKPFFNPSSPRYLDVIKGEEVLLYREVCNITNQYDGKVRRVTENKIYVKYNGVEYIFDRYGYQTETRFVGYRLRKKVAGE